MKKIEDLKQGDEFYIVTSQYLVIHYTYLCVHPSGKGFYHVIINQEDLNPQRVYFTELRSLLHQNLNTWGEAQQALVTKMESDAMTIRKTTPYFKDND
jgi:hypothetical protein